MQRLRGLTRFMLLFFLTAPLAGCLASLNGWNLWLHPNYEGQVVDAESGKPVADATVVWVNRNLSAETDSLGRFRFDGKRTRKHIVPFGDVGVIYSFRVSHHQYAEQEVKNFYVKYAPATRPEVVRLEPVRLQQRGS